MLRYITLTGLVLVFFALGGSATQAVVPDTAAVREPMSPTLSTSEVLLYVPTKLLEIPILLTKGFTKLVISGAERSPGSGGSFWSYFGSHAAFSPIISAGARSGIVGGVGFNFRSLAADKDRLKLSFTHSSNDYQNYGFKYFTPENSSSASKLKFFGSYQNRTRERFLGTGRSSKLSDEVAYRMERTEIGAEVKRELSSSVSVTLLGRYVKSQVFDGESPAVESRLTAIQSRLALTDEDVRPSKVWSFGTTLRHDTRNDKGQPSAGGQELLEVTIHRGPENSGDVEYISSRIDLRRFVHVYDQRILAFRLMAKSLDQTSGSRPVPFYLLNRLGSGDDLRGFKSDRFVGADLALASVEYRYPIWDVVDAFLLLDAARLFKSINSDFTFRNWETAYGFGLRVWKPDRLIVSATFAHSTEENRFYLQAGKEF